MKGGDLADQHAQDHRDAEVQWIFETFNVDIKTDSHSYERHGADVSDAYLCNRLLGIEDAAPVATRFLSEDTHMFCREACIAMNIDLMNKQEWIDFGQFEASWTFSHPIGEGVGRMSIGPDGAPEIEQYIEICKSVFYFTYDYNRDVWMERTGFPDVRR